MLVDDTPSSVIIKLGWKPRSTKTYTTSLNSKITEMYPIISLLGRKLYISTTSSGFEISNQPHETTESHESKLTPKPRKEKTKHERRKFYSECMEQGL